jgi:hypothetical protein
MKGIEVPRTWPETCYNSPRRCSPWTSRHSRRSTLKSDRFFTRDFTPAVYSQAGIDWIASNDFKSVLIRHYPELAPMVQNLGNSFQPWRAVPVHAAGSRVRESNP